MNKKLLLPLITLAIIGVGLVTSTKVFAQNTTMTNHLSNLVDKIAAKFNLNKADVQAVFYQDRKEHQAEMEAKYEERLSQYVTDGKITEAQKALILAKHKELKASRQENRPDLKNMTEEERKAAMEANKTKMDEERKALEDWATQNGIDIKYLMGGFGMGRHGGGPGGPPLEFPKNTDQ